jgi:hypothetical protein
MSKAESEKAWKKANTVMINARLQRSTDADILQYLSGKSISAEIKRGLRLLIANENRKTEEG